MSIPTPLAELIAAGHGTFTITTTTRKVLTCKGYYFPVDSTLTKIEKVGSTDDVRLEMMDDEDGTIPAGSFITPDLYNEELWSAITLASGSCTGIKA